MVAPLLLLRYTAFMARRKKSTDNSLGQLVDEGEKAFLAFCDFFKQGPDRSHDVTAKNLGKQKSLILRWSCRYNWESRIQRWNNEQMKVFRDAVLEETRTAAKEHIRLSRDIQKIIDERLKTFDAKKLNADNLAKWFDISTKIERLALEQPTENVGLSNPAGGELTNRIEVVLVKPGDNNNKS